MNGSMIFLLGLAQISLLIAAFYTLSSALSKERLYKSSDCRKCARFCPEQRLSVRTLGFLAVAVVCEGMLQLAVGIIIINLLGRGVS